MSTEKTDALIDAYESQKVYVNQLERRLAEVTEQRDTLLNIAVRWLRGYQHLYLLSSIKQSFTSTDVYDETWQTDDLTYIKQVMRSMK